MRSENDAFSSALSFCILVNELKQRGHLRAPGFANALKVARDMGNQKLADWVSQQEHSEHFGDLLRLHWNISGHPAR